VSSRPAGTKQQDPVSKQTNKRKSKKNNKKENKKS
jgi:hypothetical protein